jgi:hypothetical protein
MLHHTDSRKGTRGRGALVVQGVCFESVDGAWSDSSDYRAGMRKREGGGGVRGERRSGRGTDSGVDLAFCQFECKSAESLLFWGGELPRAVSRATVPDTPARCHMSAHPPTPTHTHTQSGHSDGCSSNPHTEDKYEIEGSGGPRKGGGTRVRGKSRERLPCRGETQRNACTFGRGQQPRPIV